MRGHFWAFGNDYGVDVADAPAMLCQQIAGVGEEGAAGRAMPARVAGGEVAADVAQRRCAEQGIDDGVNQHVSVGMPRQPARVGDGDAADHQGAPFGEAMYVVADAYSYSHKMLFLW